MPFLGSSPARGLVGENDIDDNVITLAKMAGGTDGNLITYDASGDPAVVAAGTSGHFLKSQGAGSVPVFAAAGGFTEGTEVNTSSGTSHSFTSIPAGPKMIVLQLVGVGLASGADLSVQIGDSGGIETSGYLSLGERDGVTQEQSTASFNIPGSSGDLWYGHMTLTLEDAAAFTWVASLTGVVQNNSEFIIGGGRKSLSAELTQMQLSGGTFNAGAANVIYI